MQEAQHSLAGLLVGVSGELALEAGTAVDAAVVGQETIDRLLDGFQGRGGGGVVEVDVGAQTAVEHGHHLIDADDSFTDAQ